MKTRKITLLTILFILIGSIFAGAISALDQAAPVAKPTLQNVRAYAAATSDDGRTFAVDGGNLLAGEAAGWTALETPSGVIVNAVATDAANPNVVYIGAANELALYRSTDGGANWMRVPLTNDYVGGVTAIAVDSAQRLVYVGTDTAGLYRLRDVGSSMIVNGHLQLEEPVLEVAADGSGSGMVFARTAWTLYRAENFGLRWLEVTNLGTAPTALAVAQTNPATVWVGTTDRGLLKSFDGLTWTAANEGLGMAPGTRLQVDALAVDPQQPAVMYVATSYLFGSTTLHQTPVGVSMTTDGGASWAQLNALPDTAVVELLPIAGESAGIYALTKTSRTPLPLGNTTAIESRLATQAATVDAETETTAATSVRTIVAWIVAGMAALALAFALAMDLGHRRTEPQAKAGNGSVEPSYVKHS